MLPGNPFGPAFPIVDTHSHVIAPDTVRYPLAPLGGQPSAWSRERPVDGDGMRQALDEAGVQQTLLVQASTCYGLDNRYVQDCVQAHPQRFGGVYAIDLVSPGAIDRIEHWRTAGLHGARVFVAGHTAAADDVRLDDPRADAAWAHLGRHRVPVCVQLRADKLVQLRPVLERHPEVVVLLDHCARPVLDDDAPYAQAAPLFELARFPQLVLKFTTHNLKEAAQGRATPGGFLRALVDAFGASRIAWGSNHPASPGGLRAQLAQALDAARELSADEQAWIFGGTAHRVYPALKAASLAGGAA